MRNGWRPLVLFLGFVFLAEVSICDKTELRHRQKGGAKSEAMTKTMGRQTVARKTAGARGMISKEGSFRNERRTKK